MDLNHILLFIAFVSPIILLARSRRSATPQRGWRNASLATLFVTGVSWLLFPAVAGYMAAGAWFFLLLLPAVGGRKMADLALRQRYGAARRIADLLKILHPADEVPAQAAILRALELAQHGRTDEALERLARLRSDQTSVGRQATAQSFAVRGDWPGLIAWCRTPAVAPILSRDPEVLPLYFRALGETHALDELVLQLASRIQTIGGEAPEGPALQLCLLILFAFCGRPAAFVRLNQSRPGSFSAEGESFWLATCELAGGQLAAGRAQLEKLRARTKDAILQSHIAIRLRNADTYASTVARLAPENSRILQRLETVRIRTVSPFLATRGRGTPVVVTLIALNVLMFMVEMWMGGSQNPIVLHRLGQLETWGFLARHEYWRLVTSLFLHFGVLHLGFNLYALFILGPALERTIGAARFLACYLLSGIGSGLGVVLLHLLRFTPPQEVVGASGSIMGVVGAWAGMLLKNRHLPLAGRRLQSIIVIVAIQTAFDLSTPQISMAAHMSGLISGLILGLLLAPRQLRA